MIWLSPSVTNNDGSKSYYIMSPHIIYGGITLIFIGLIGIRYRKVFNLLFILFILISYKEIIDYNSSSFFIGLNNISIEVLTTSILGFHIFLNKEILKFFSITKDPELTTEKAEVAYNQKMER